MAPSWTNWAEGEPWDWRALRWHMSRRKTKKIAKSTSMYIFNR